jgi:hypothetical protein
MADLTGEDGFQRSFRRLEHVDRSLKALMTLWMLRYYSRDVSAFWSSLPLISPVAAGEASFVVGARCRCICYSAPDEVGALRGACPCASPELCGGPAISAISPGAVLYLSSTGTSSSLLDRAFLHNGLAGGTVSTRLRIAKPF